MSCFYYKSNVRRLFHEFFFLILNRNHFHHTKKCFTFFFLTLYACINGEHNFIRCCYMNVEWRNNLAFSIFIMLKVHIHISKWAFVCAYKYWNLNVQLSIRLTSVFSVHEKDSDRAHKMNINCGYFHLIDFNCIFEYPEKIPSINYLYH